MSDGELETDEATLMKRFHAVRGRKARRRDNAFLVTRIALIAVLL
jgi:hypothetical protein